MNDRLFDQRPIIDWRCAACERLKSEIVVTGCGLPNRTIRVPYITGVREERVNACPLVPVYGARPRTLAQRIKDFLRS